MAEPGIRAQREAPGSVLIPHTRYGHWPFSPCSTLADGGLIPVLREERLRAVTLFSPGLLGNKREPLPRLAHAQACKAISAAPRPSDPGEVNSCFLMVGWPSSGGISVLSLLKSLPALLGASRTQACHAMGSE